MKRPRTLFVLPATVRGGAEIRLLSMIDAFDAIEPVLLAHRSLPGALESRVEVHCLDDHFGCGDPYPYDVRNVRNHARAIAAVAKWVGADVTFGWMHNGSAFVAAATLCGLKTKTLGSVLGPLSDHFRLSGRRATLYERLLFGFAFRRLDHLVVPSSGVLEDMTANFFASPRRTSAIYNGIKSDRVRELARARSTEGPPEKARRWIISAARLSLEKGFDVLLQAFKRLRAEIDVDLILLGDGPERERLESLARSLSVHEHVLFAGHVDNPFPWLAQADVFAMTSRLEGFGNALVEAMALEIPIVSTSCPWGPREILAAPDAGVLVPVDDEAALASALKRVLLDVELSERLSRGGRNRAHEFSFEKMLTAYERLIRAAVQA
jgi:glycosyltransferase involved in cell wall biosynthesis